MELRNCDSLQNYKVSELKLLCKKEGISGYSNLKKSKLIDILKQNKKSNDKIGQIQSDIWIKKDKIKSFEELSSFTKVELIKIYNDTAKNNNFPYLSATLYNENKKTIQHKVYNLTTNYVVCPPDIINVSSIPKIPIGTYVQTEITDGFFKTCSGKLFGKVSKQNKDGTLILNIFDSVKIDEKNIGSKIIHTHKLLNTFVSEKIKAKPFANDDHWNFISGTNNHRLDWKNWDGDLSITFDYIFDK